MVVSMSNTLSNPTPDMARSIMTTKNTVCAMSERVEPTHLVSTTESFSISVGGRFVVIFLFDNLVSKILDH